mmetsp:Transcript_69593/g.201691  ORF Transcript_69593/g.201691 Transcript_69593/m.201691 type:complete len:407 (+) Transcript_69593:209-1429(+)
MVPAAQLYRGFAVVLEIPLQALDVGDGDLRDLAGVVEVSLEDVVRQQAHTFARGGRGHEVHERIADIPLRALVDRQVQKVVHAGEADEVQLFDEHFPGVHVREVSQHQGGDAACRAAAGGGAATRAGAAAAHAPAAEAGMQVRRLRHTAMTQYPTTAAATTAGRFRVVGRENPAALGVLGVAPEVELVVVGVVGDLVPMDTGTQQCGLRFGKLEQEAPCHTRRLVVLHLLAVVSRSVLDVVVVVIVHVPSDMLSTRRRAQTHKRRCRSRASRYARLLRRRRRLHRDLRQLVQRDRRCRHHALQRRRQRIAAGGLQEDGGAGPLASSHLRIRDGLVRVRRPVVLVVRIVRRRRGAGGHNGAFAGVGAAVGQGHTHPRRLPARPPKVQLRDGGSARHRSGAMSREARK